MFEVLSRVLQEYIVKITYPEVPMQKSNAILRGTFILTAAGLLSRFMGFFYRIFLSRIFGEEGVGLYQLIFPVYALCISLTCAGIETAISRTVARRHALHQYKEARETLFLGLFLSVLLSVFVLLFIQAYAEVISVRFLQEARCRPLLIVMSYVLPFSSVHSCICGYFFGLREAKVPAISQLVEQSARILSVYALYLFFTRNHLPLTAAAAVAGLVIGELFSAVYSAYCISGRSGSGRSPLPSDLSGFRKGLAEKTASGKACLKELLSLSFPLTANRVLLNLLQSLEAVSIPARLKLFSHSTSEALSLYGVLTGMALPMILFPSAITSSVSLMLTPTVAEIQASSQHEQMIPLVRKAAGSCFLLGTGCGIFFLLSGPWIGTCIFGSELAGRFISTLAWICPFLYTNTAFLSVLNGLGKTVSAFRINTFGLLIRIAGVFLAIPLFGIQGYLWGMLASQLSISVLCMFALRLQRTQI